MFLNLSELQMRKNSLLIKFIFMLNYCKNGQNAANSIKLKVAISETDFCKAPLSGSGVKSNSLPIYTLKSCFVFLLVILYLVKHTNPPSISTEGPTFYMTP